jgi:hypothetical protein
MGGFYPNNLMKWIMDFLLNECNFGGMEIAANLVVFGVDGTSVFQGIKSSVIIITCGSWAPLSFRCPLSFSLS